MTTSRPPFRELHAIDLAASFNDSRQTPYVAVFITYGKEPHVFGSSEFTTMKALEADIEKEAARYELNRDGFNAYFGHNAAVITFASKKIHASFMRAMHGHNVTAHDLVVQVAHKSPEWHHAAGQYVAYTNRVRREEKIQGKPLGFSNVPMFGGLLVDYSFPDLATMKDFCQRVNSGQFDTAAAELKKSRPQSDPQVS